MVKEKYLVRNLINAPISFTYNIIKSIVTHLKKKVNKTYKDTQYTSSIK